MEVINTDTFDSVFIELNCPSKEKIIIGALYRPPGTDLPLFNNEFECMLHKLILKNTKVILAGDYNINLLNHSINAATENFLNILYAQSLLPMIKRPTRYNKDTATLIDNILTNVRPDHNQFSGIIIHDISDHLPVFFVAEGIGTINRACNYVVRQIRQINQENLENLSCKLQGVVWQDIDNPDVNVIYENFDNIFNDLYNETLPIKVKQIKFYCNKYKPWLTHGILTSVKKKNDLYKKCLNKNTPESKDIYIRYKNKLTNIIRNSKKLYYKNQFELLNGNMRETWKLINKVMQNAHGNKQMSSIKEISHNGQIVSDPLQIANKFNDFFTSIGPDLANKLPLMHANASIADTMPSPNVHSLFVEPCTEAEIICITNNLATTKGIGLDGYSIKVIKSVIGSIAVPLNDIFNKSFATGLFPDKLKYAKVTPVFKNDDKFCVNNYRPISVLPIFSKILEKLMCHRLMAFVNKHNILCENQYGFREQHSTYMALLNVIDQISEEMDNKKYSIGIFLDLSKAFDTIDHSILLKKLEIYGIRGVALKWFSNYLLNRSQCVAINDVISLPNDIKCGVPQGSILGPVLFILYINDIVRVSKLLQFVMFADDTNLFFSHKNLDTLVQTVNNE
jgi:hypothetical protein